MNSYWRRRVFPLLDDCAALRDQHAADRVRLVARLGSRQQARDGVAHVDEFARPNQLEQLLRWALRGGRTDGAVDDVDGGGDGDSVPRARAGEERVRVTGACRRTV